MPIIKSPVPDYTGQTGSVVFVNGEGFTEDANHIEWFKEHGYEVVEDEPPTDPSPEPPNETPPNEPPTDLDKTGSKKASSKK